MTSFIKKTSAYTLLLLAAALHLLQGTPVQAAFPQEIHDSQGNTVVVTKPFTRIISLYTAHTENLCAMGAEAQLAGISRSDDYPESILSKPRFSYREDAEKFIALQPDLVLIRPMIDRSYPLFVKKLKEAGIEVISLQPTSITEMLEYWKTLGILSGHERQAEEMVAQFLKEVEEIDDTVAQIPENARPKVYFAAIHAKMKTFTETSIGIFILETAGGINIAHDASQVRTTNIADFGKEKLLSRGDDIDIFLCQQGRMNPVTKNVIIEEPGFRAIRAVREDNVYLIEEQLVSRPTMRILKGIEKVHTIFFAEKRKNYTQETDQ